MEFYLAIRIVGVKYITKVLSHQMNTHMNRRQSDEKKENMQLNMHKIK